jgi:hypothetical protein
VSTEFDPAELTALLEAILGGDVGPAERARLEAILAGNRAARRYYARYMLVRALLVQESGGTRRAEPPPARVGRGRGAPANVREEVLAFPIADRDDEAARELGPRDRGPWRASRLPARLAAAAALLIMGSLGLVALGRGRMG